MLNISNNSVSEKGEKMKFKSFDLTFSSRFIRMFTRWLYAFVLVSLLIMFMPWTQNVQGAGQVTAFRPEQRPQTLQNPIPGRIAQWYVVEGDTVNKGDTLVHIAEIKDEYFDPEIILRITEEIDAKEDAAIAYGQKADAQEQQITALRQNLEYRLRQATLQVAIDSAGMEAARLEFSISERQFARVDTLFREGLKSRVDWEIRRQRMQEAQARSVLAQNRYLNAITELNALEADYRERISKAESELYSAISQRNATLADLAKLRNKLSNVNVRRGFYYITAPQRGMVTRTLKTGIGENIKEGEPIAEIMPLQYQIAAEIFIRPVDLPLVKIGSRGRLIFDGWPAIVFSGWPNTSFGTFAARIAAIDNNVDPKTGRYRILLTPDPNDEPWPEQLRFGSGTEGILLLNDVPVWYELWRQLNGFPPEYYAGKGFYGYTEKPKE